MNINRHNCEAFFLDYYEKNLSPVEVAELFLFLEENPDLKQAFDNYEEFFLEREKLDFPDKAYLKKKFSASGIDEILVSEINRSNYEEFFIASTENLLSDEQKQKLNAFLNEHPALQDEFLLYQKCKLQAEEFCFEKKESLKKEMITAQNREEFFIRAIENQLSEAEQTALNQFLQKNPDEKKEFEMYRKTILVPERVIFPWKSQLKKKESKEKSALLPNPVFTLMPNEFAKSIDMSNPDGQKGWFGKFIQHRDIFLYSRQTAYYAAAAVILLLIGLFFLLRNPDTPPVYIVNKNNSVNNNISTRQKESPSTQQTENHSKDADKQSEEQKKKTSSSHSFSHSPLPHIPVLSKTNLEEKEEVIRQPVVSEDLTDLIAKKEKQTEIIKEEKENSSLLADAQTEQKIENSSSENNPPDLLTSVTTANTQADEYISLSTFINKKIRTLLGINNSGGCDDSEKIGVWDLAMAAKNGMQKAIGMQSVDVKKVCNSKADKVEYIFAAGNFEFSKSGLK